MKEQTQDQHPVVTIVKDKAMTTSWEVARYFDKQHPHVLRTIRDIINESKNGLVDIEFNERNFAPAEYTDEKGEKRPMYQMTRDGFTLLAMGFTGPKAMKFKIAYISAFNKMEEALRRIQTETLIDQVKRDALAYFRKGVGLAALIRDKGVLKKVKTYYYLRVHSKLSHVDAGFLARLEGGQADEVSRVLRDCGLALPVIHDKIREQEIDRFFAEACGGFLPQDINAVLAAPGEEVRS